MTLNLQLAPGVHEKLIEEARAAGISVADLVQRILEAHAGDVSNYRKLSGPEAAARFREWATSFPKPTGMITLEELIGTE